MRFTLDQQLANNEILLYINRLEQTTEHLRRSYNPTGGLARKFEQGDYRDKLDDRLRILGNTIEHLELQLNWIKQELRPF